MIDLNQIIIICILVVLIIVTVVLGENKKSDKPEPSTSENHNGEYKECTFNMCKVASNAQCIPFAISQSDYFPMNQSSYDSLMNLLDSPRTPVPLPGEDFNVVVGDIKLDKTDIETLVEALFSGSLSNEREQLAFVVYRDRVDGMILSARRLDLQKPIERMSPICVGETCTTLNADLWLPKGPASIKYRNVC